MNRTDLIRHPETHDLPEGWAETTVGKVAEDISYGFTAKASSSEAGPRYLRITDLQNGTVDWESVPSCRIPKEKIQKYVLRSGDLVFARTGATTGKSFLVRSCPEAVFASYLIRVRPSTSVLPEFLALFFQTSSYWNQISENISGSAQPNCNATKLASLNVPIPPLDEQRRIVAKLEEVLGNVDACQKRLAKIPVILKRFRQSVLASACSGRLTAEWRDANSHCESAFELLSRMSENHQAEVEALAQHECPDDEIPSTWTWVRFGDLISELRNGVSIRPNMEPPGTPILRISAARPGRVDLDDIRYLSRGEVFFPLYKLADRDLLFTRYNGSLELLGVCGMVRDLGSRELLYPDKLMRVRFEHSFVMPEYTEIFFQAVSVHERVIAKAKSSAGQNGVSGADIKSQPFALPPPVEQEQIVRRVEALFKLADQIEAPYKKAQVQVDRLTQSILAKAFRGELVPTEAELARRDCQIGSN